MKSLRFCTVWCLFALLCYAEAQIFSCGGFIRSPTPIDYSKIKVKLLTPEGHLKHEEDVNVQNGYYMIPVYNKGKYSLKVAAPEGWFFAPDSYDFTLDGTTDKCSKNEDIDFSLTGFSISGVVESGEGTGPEGLALTLQKDGQTVGNALTAAGGKYHFKALPGKYEVSASADSSICIGRGNTAVEVKSEPILVTPNLRISGYQLTVKVTNKGSQLAGAQLFLYSNNNPQLSQCSLLKEAVAQAPGAKFVCSLGTTSATQSTVVPCLPPGNYQLEAKYSEGSVQFRFDPPVQTVQVVSGKVQTSFSVAGFVAKGQLKGSNKEPIRDAEILLNGKTVAKTDNNGQFTLENLQESPSITLTARLPHHHFSTVKTALQLPRIALPDITVEAYDVCGSVELDERGSASKLTAKALTQGNADVVIAPNANGEFCHPLKPGKYEINPSDSSLMPRGQPLDVTASPLLDLRFTHFKTSAEVRAVCIGSCPQMTVTLLLGERIVQKAKGTDVFTFSDIGPAEYRVRIEDGGYACWEKTELSLSVQRAKPTPVQFIQNAFYTTIDITHEAKMKWSHLENKQLKGEESLKSGINQICVPAQGRYKLEFSACIKFDQQTVEHVVPNTLPVVIQGIEASLSGYISGGDTSITVKIKSPSGDERIVPVTGGRFTFPQPINQQGGIQLIPQSTTYLFEPPTVNFEFRGSCNEKAAEFEAVKGIFIEGRIEPAVEGAKVTSTNKRHAEVTQTATSDKNGRFRLGPVKAIDDYDFVAELDGYRFIPKGQPGHFSSVKLSQLSVVLTDSETSQRLDGVLLSVVGGIDHRSNRMIDSSGQIKFPGLAPGDYFLRPILQEYKFEPSTTKITIKEGEHENVELKGKRVAYSAYGHMRQMSNSPVANVIIEALSEQCEQHQSEAVTDAEGAFRLRGLKPACNYRLYPKGYSDSNAIPPAYPNQYDVRMTAADVKNLQFVMMPFEQVTQLAVEIEFDKIPVPQSYRVTVYKSGESVQSSLVQSPVTVFYMNGLKRDGAEYSVRVEPDKPPQAFSAKTVFFNADAPVRVVRVPMTTTRRANEVEISFGSLLSVPFFGLLALFFFNQNKSIELAKQLYERFTGTPVDRRKKKN